MVSSNKITSVMAVSAFVLLTAFVSQTTAYPMMCYFEPVNAATKFDPSKCDYGVETDACGHVQCAKGPGKWTNQKTSYDFLILEL